MLVSCVVTHLVSGYSDGIGIILLEYMCPLNFVSADTLQLFQDHFQSSVGEAFESYVHLYEMYHQFESIDTFEEFWGEAQVALNPGRNIEDFDFPEAGIKAYEALEPFLDISSKSIRREIKYSDMK